MIAHSKIHARRLLSPNDKEIRTVSSLQNECFGFSWGFDALKQLVTTENVLTLLANTPHRENSVGYLMARSLHDEAEILTMGVQAPCRKMGIGTILVMECRMWAQEKRVSNILLEVEEFNYAAQRVYEKCKFDHVGRRRCYYSTYRNDMTDALILRATLTTKNGQ
tara:strand:- start:617 stop:1111 length:495 start_codon:yes stop_codon:yes gene_type:complete